MTIWLATDCNPAEKETNCLTIPSAWLPDLPEFDALFEVNAQCLRLYESFITTSERTYEHHVHASYLPDFETHTSQKPDEFLIDQMCAHARRRLNSLGALHTEEYDEDEEARSWVSTEGLFKVEVYRSELLPTIGVIEFSPATPDFCELIKNSPLGELASLSGDVWTVESVSCGRSLEGRPKVCLQARDSGPNLDNRLIDLGFEKRNQVWWNQSTAVQELSGGAWNVMNPAPSFVPGYRK